MKAHSLMSKTLLPACVGVLLCGCASQPQTNLDVPNDPYPWCADQRREAAQFAPTLDGSDRAEELRQTQINASVDMACQNRPIQLPTHP